MPDLETLIWQQLAGEGVLVYGLHADEPPDQLAHFIEQTGITFPVMHGNYSIAAFDFPVVGYPFPRQVVIDKRGVIRALRQDLNVEQLAALIRDLLAE